MTVGTDDNNLELTDLVDVRILQKIQDDFSVAMNMSCMIIGLEANPITKASNLCQLCHGLIRKTGAGEAACRLSNRLLGEQATRDSIPTNWEE